MTKTKTRDIGIAFAILAGILFLFCTVTKLIATFTPELAYLHDRWIYDGQVNFIQVDELCCIIEVLALAGLSAICFSRKRTNALIFAYLAIGFVNIKMSIDSVWYTAADLVKGNFDIFAILVTVFMLISVSFNLLALLFFTIQTATNTRFEKGIVSQVFLGVLAFGAAVSSSFVYLPHLTADVLGLFVSGKLGVITNGLGGVTEVVLVPLMNNIVALMFSGGAFFLALWLAFRPKTYEVLIETKEEKKARIAAEKDAKKAENEAKKADKAAKKAEADALKAAQKAEKDALKAAKKAEKDAEKTKKKAEKDAIKAAKAAETEKISAEQIEKEAVIEEIEAELTDENAELK